MPKLRLVAVVPVSLTIAAISALIACSDDTTTNPTDGGLPDSPGADTSVESGPTEAGADSSETGSPDAGVTLANLADIVSAHMCNALAKCCFGNANPADGGLDGGGTFNRPQCLQLYEDIGFENSSVGHTVFTSGNVTLDKTKANDCIAKIDTMACTLSGPTLQDIRTTCFGAVTGSVAAGSPCAQSAECATGLFCQPTTPSAGLAGTCTTLKADGEACALFDNSVVGKAAVKSEEACSYRGSGVPALYCDSLDPADSQNYSDPATWTCKSSVANGESCNDSTWCTNGVCDPNTYTCVTMSEYFSKTYSCDQQTIP